MSVATAHREEDSILQRDARGGGIVELRLNRPAAYNALSSGLMTLLQQQLDELADDPACRTIIISGNGPGFCAGHDLKEVQELPDAAARKSLMDQCCRLMKTIVRSPKPVIAKVHGIATAAGCQLVASADLAIATDGCRFATPGVNIGLFCHTPMVALGRNVSRKHAMEMLLTGELIQAEDAVRFGLINRAVREDALDDAVMTMARRIAGKSSYTLRVGKEAFYRQLEMDLDGAYDYAAEVMVSNMMAADAHEGISAFIEKRTPAWQDR